MFRYAVCDPLKPDPLEMGAIEREKILETFDRFPWADLFNKMKTVEEEDVYYAPTLEIENKINRHILSITLREIDGHHKFNIFYSRPKTVTRFFGLIKDTNDYFFSEREELPLGEVRNAVEALVADDLKTLEKRWG